MDEMDERENYEVRITNYKKEDKPGFLFAQRRWWVENPPYQNDQRGNEGDKRPPPHLRWEGATRKKKTHNFFGGYASGNLSMDVWRFYILR